MNLNIQVALIGALGGLIGGGVTSFVTYMFGLEADRQELLQTARRNAYLDWLDVKEFGTQAEALRDQLKQLRETEGTEPEQIETYSTELKKLDKKYALEGWQALAQIGVYGDAGVVKSVAAWLRSFDETVPCIDAEAWKLDIAVYQSMRASLIREDKDVSDAELSDLVLRCSEPLAVITKGN